MKRRRKDIRWKGKIRCSRVGGAGPRAEELSESPEAFPKCRIMTGGLAQFIVRGVEEVIIKGRWEFKGM